MLVALVDLESTQDKATRKPMKMWGGYSIMPPPTPCPSSPTSQGTLYCKYMQIPHVKQFPAVNRVYLFWGGRYNNQDRPNISQDKLLTTCLAILGAQKNNVRLINEILCMLANRD